MSNRVRQDVLVKTNCEIETGRAEVNKVGAGQLEFRLAPDTQPQPGKPGSVRRPRRSAGARWWFAQMRETVRAAQEWVPPSSRWGVEGQQTLELPTSPTRFHDPEGGFAAAGVGAGD